jgi:hypothetical protein
VQTDAVGGTVGVEPLLGVDLVGAENGADLVVEDLGGGSRQRGEAGVLEPAEVGGEVLAEAARARRPSRRA